MPCWTSRAHQPEHGHQLLAHQRMLGEPVEICGQRSEQHLDRRVHGESRAGGQVGRRTAYGLEIGLLAAPEGKIGERLGLLGGDQVCAHPFEFGDGLVVDRVVDDAGLLGRADHRRVEGLGDEDVDDGGLDVGRSMQVDGRVAGPDAERGLSGRVGQSDDLLAAGHPDEVDPGVSEQIMGHLMGGVGDDLQRARGHARRLGCSAQDLDGALA